MTFAALALDPGLLRGLHDLGFSRPTPIQKSAIPPALEGRDLVACASTGSGKTAAFLLPIAHHLIPMKRGATRALVLTPTRELAAQIADQLTELAVHTPVTGAAVYGGVGMGPQEHALRSGVDIIIATPGRLLDHLRAPYAKLASLKYLVLDEADRMLDMGFLPDIHRILRHLPVKRQTLLFSATMPREIETLARQMLHNPVSIETGRQAQPAAGVRQVAFPVPQTRKSALLLELLKRGELKTALVFTRTKHRADRVAQFLTRGGVQAGRIHGNRSQGQRTSALDAFKSLRTPVLVATDIAARGIDVEDLGHVVNYDVPHVADDYIHRVGRTARAGKTGDAFTFVSPEEEHDFRAIEKAIGIRVQRVKLVGFDTTAVEPALPSSDRAHGDRAHGERQRGRARRKVPFHARRRGR
jgi:ATP-dependent RNA helicase RhlE